MSFAKPESQLRAALLAVMGTMLMLPLGGNAGVYKYEENGQTIYQDRAPESTQDNGHTILNNNGVALQQVMSREERRLARLRAEEVRLARIRDRALLATFTTEDDLVRTRDDRMGMIDGLISRLDDRIRILSERLTLIQQRIETQESDSANSLADENLYVEREGIKRNIENAWSLIDSKAAERQVLSTKFDSDLERYRELKAER